MKKLHAVCFVLTLLLLLASVAWGRHAKAPVHPQSMQNPGIAPEISTGSPDVPECGTAPDPYCMPPDCCVVAL